MSIGIQEWLRRSASAYRVSLAVLPAVLLLICGEANCVAFLCFAPHGVRLVAGPQPCRDRTSWSYAHVIFSTRPESVAERHRVAVLDRQIARCRPLCRHSTDSLQYRFDGRFTSHSSASPCLQPG